MTDDKQDSRRPVTGDQVMKMIDDVDKEFDEWIRKDRAAAIRDYLDWCRRETVVDGILGVYYIGNMGWVSEDEWDEVFARQPEWARDAYMIEAEESWSADMEMGLCEDIAAAYNEGGMDALGEWMERFDPDTVFYSQIWNDELEQDFAEELADLGREAPAARTGATSPSPAQDTTGPGIGI